MSMWKTTKHDKETKEELNRELYQCRVLEDNIVKTSILPSLIDTIPIKICQLFVDIIKLILKFI